MENKEIFYTVYEGRMRVVAWFMIIISFVPMLFGLAETFKPKYSMFVGLTMTLVSYSNLFRWACYLDAMRLEARKRTIRR